MKSNLIRSSRTAAIQLFSLAIPTKRFSGFLVALPIAFSFMVPQASAATVSYYIDQSNDLANGTNYAQVTIAENGSDIDFTVDVFEAEFPAPLSNFGMQTFLFNYNNTLDISNITFTDVDPASWQITTVANAGGGFGKFEFEWAGNGSTRTSSLSFSITNVAGDTAADYVIGADWLNNGSSEFFSAHIAGYDDSASGNSSGKFAGSTVVPIPAGVWLFASALGALVVSRRRVS